MAAQPQAFIGNQALVIRRATPADAEVCGRICFEAFGTLADKHNFPRDFPSPEIPTHVLSTMFSHPSFFCVVAEQDGKVIGSNCLDERTPVAGVGPITIDPGTQNRSVGRQLMQAVMSRAAEREFAGVRLVRRLTTIARSLFTRSWASWCASRSPACKVRSRRRLRAIAFAPLSRTTLEHATISACEPTDTTVAASLRMQFSKELQWLANRMGELKRTRRP